MHDQSHTAAPPTPGAANQAEMEVDEGEVVDAPAPDEQDGSKSANSPGEWLATDGKAPPHVRERLPASSLTSTSQHGAVAPVNEVRRSA